MYKRGWKVIQTNGCVVLIRFYNLFSLSLGNALDELRRVIAVLQSPHAHTTALPSTPVSYDLLHGFPGKLFQGVSEMQGLVSGSQQAPTPIGLPIDDSIKNTEAS